MAPRLMHAPSGARPRPGVRAAAAVGGRRRRLGVALGLAGPLALGPGALAAAAPPASETRADPQPPARPPPPFEIALAALRSAREEIDLRVADAAPRLVTAIDRLADHAPALAADAAARALRVEALLALARAQLAEGDEPAARATIDEALACAMVDGLPAIQFGPRLARVIEAQQAARAAAPRATLALSCARPCGLFVAEQAFEPPVELPAGTYRVWIEASDGSVAPLRVQLTLDPGATHRLVYPPPIERPSARPVEPEGPARDPRPRRLAPRWAELTGLGLGVVGVGAGVGLLVIDGRCPGGGPTTGENACSKVFTTQGAGIALLVGGVVVAGLSTVLLAIDEARANSGRRPAARRR